MSVELDPRYVKDTEPASRGTEIWHLDGVAWHDAPIPWRLHRCWAQTFGYVNWFTPIQRCACGAANFDDCGWVEKNERRRHR
jgi:hypothetical protein